MKPPPGRYPCVSGGTMFDCLPPPPYPNEVHPGNAVVWQYACEGCNRSIQEQALEIRAAMSGSR